MLIGRLNSMSWFLQFMDGVLSDFHEKGAWMLHKRWPSYLQNILMKQGIATHFTDWEDKETKSLTQCIINHPW